MAKKRSSKQTKKRPYGKKGSSVFSSTKRALKRWWRTLKKWTKYTIFTAVLVVAVFVAYVIYASSHASRKYHRTVASTEYNGIDVSKFQGNIDWNQVADDARIQFVYIKASEGGTRHDNAYERNFEAAQRAGFHVGSYHYFIGRVAAKEQFANFNKIVDKDKQDILPVVDVEERGNALVNRNVLRRNLTEFLELVKEEYGRYPIIYSQYKFYNDHLAPQFNRYTIFIARYSSASPIIKGGGKYSIWQYSERGKISGIKGKVDLDRFGDGVTLNDIKL